MNPYRERVNQFVVEYHEEVSAEHKAAYRIRGMNPDDIWNLKWSFTTLADAQAQAEVEQKNHNDFCVGYGCEPWQTYRVRDLGKPVEIERSGWF